MSMNVRWVLMPVPRSAMTHLAPTTVAVILGTLWTLMDALAMVCTKAVDTIIIL